MLFFLAVFACGQEPIEPSSATVLLDSSQNEESLPLWQDSLPPAQFVAAADFDGDGVDERVWSHEGRLYWPGGDQEIQGNLKSKDYN